MSFLLPPLPPNFEAALRDVQGKRPESRVAAAERLGRASDAERPRALDGLRALARDAHPSVRATAVSALGSLAVAEGLDAVVAALSDESPHVRELAVIATAEIGGDQALAAVRSALRSKWPEVRFQAISAVTDLAPQQAVNDLLPLLQDADPEVRAQAVSGLSVVSQPHLAGHFAGALQDESSTVRLEAALALAELGDARGEQQLLSSLDQRDRLLEIAPALAKLASKNAIEPLARLAGGLFTSPYVRAGVGAALVRLGDPRGARALRRVLVGLRPDARSYAVELTREVRAGDLVPELTRLAKRPRGADLLTVVDALATFAPESDAARLALEQLAARTDEVGERAKAALKLG